jgi:hypothetical protein
LYGIDTPRWLPANNPKAHDLTRDGFPWFGDEIELLINATNHWTGNQDSAGNGSSWQMVCNLTKSRKGGIGAGGLLEGEPRRSADAWAKYQEWILSGAQECVAKPKPGGKTWTSRRRVPITRTGSITKTPSPARVIHAPNCAISVPSGCGSKGESTSHFCWRGIRRVGARPDHHQFDLEQGNLASGISTLRLVPSTGWPRDVAPHLRGCAPVGESHSG